MPNRSTTPTTKLPAPRPRHVEFTRRSKRRQNVVVSPHDHDGHGRGHDQDRGLRGFVRYMKMLPKMWRSPVSREVVRAIARVLRPGGRLLLVDEDFDDPEHPAFRRMQDRKGHRARHFTDIDPAAVEAKLVAAGFADVKGLQQLVGRPPSQDGSRHPLTYPGLLREVLTHEPTSKQL